MIIAWAAQAEPGFHFIFATELHCHMVGKGKLNQSKENFDKSRHQHQELGTKILIWRITMLVTDVTTSAAQPEVLRN